MKKKISKLKDQTKEIYNKYIKISLIIFAIVFYIKIIFLYWYADLRGTKDKLKIIMNPLKALLWPLVVLISEIIRAYKKLISMYKIVLESVTWLQWLRKLLMKIPEKLCLKIIPNN